MGSILGLLFGLYFKGNFYVFTRAFWLLCGLEALEGGSRESSWEDYNREFGNSDQAGSSGDGEKLADSRSLWEAGLGDEVIWAARRVRDQGYPGFLHGLHRRTRSSPCNAGDLGRAGEGRQGVQPQACAACASGGVRVEIQGFRAE